MVPQPVLALLLLFPLTKEAEAAKDAEEAAAGENITQRLMSIRWRVVAMPCAPSTWWQHVLNFSNFIWQRQREGGSRGLRTCTT